MKGFDAFPKPKETKIGKLIYNLKKPVKGKILEEEYDTFDIGDNEYISHPQMYDMNGNEYECETRNENEYECDTKNFLTDDVLYCSFDDLEEESDQEDDAVINIKPRSRILHSISEVSLSDESIESTSPPRSPPRDLEKESSQENYHSPYYVVEDNELEMYLQPNHINTQYNYAHLDASKLLNKVENMKETKSTNQHIPLHRARLGSTPAIIHHSREFVDAHPNTCKCPDQHGTRSEQVSNTCDCVMADKIKRSKSVGEISFSHARNSSSYNKFKKSRCTGPSSRFAKYIKINGVEYKVPSNVPKHDPPDLEPPPSLPPKKYSSKNTHENHISISTTEIKDIDITPSEQVLAKPIETPSTKTTKDSDIEDKLEELENMIKEFRRNEKEKETSIVDCPTYVNDSTYLDTIRQKRRQRSASQTSLFRERFESCPSASTCTYNNFERNNHFDTFSRSVTLPRASNKKSDKPLVVPNSYSIKMDSPLSTRKNEKDTNNYDLFISVKKGRANSENGVYCTPLHNDATSKTLPRCQKDSPGSSELKRNGYVYAHPAERNLSDTMDYQYAYGHNQHFLHPVAKRHASAPTTKETPQPPYRKLQYTRSNINARDVTDPSKCATYANVKCFGNTPETDMSRDANNNIDDNNLLQVPQFDVNENLHKDKNNITVKRVHEYAYITPSCESNETNNTSTQQQLQPKKPVSESLSQARVGSSYNMFQSKLDYLLPSGRFARYVNVEGSDKEYKIPSNVPKFNPPDLTSTNLLFKEKSRVNYENPVQLSFSSDNIDEIFSQGRTKGR